MKICREPKPNARYEQYYIQCAKSYADAGDYDNTNIFFDLADDFASKKEAIVERIKRNDFELRTKFQARVNSVEFAIQRAEAIMKNQEKDRMIDADCPAQRVCCAKELFDYAKKYYSLVANPMNIQDLQRFKKIESLIENYRQA